MSSGYHYSSLNLSPSRYWVEVHEEARLCFSNCCGCCASQSRHEFESSASDSAFERYTGRVSHMDTREASLGCLSVRMRFLLFILLGYEMSVIWTCEPFYLWLLFTNRRLKLHLRVRLWLIEAIAHLFLVSIEYRLVIVVLCLFATMPSFLIFPPSSVKPIDLRYPLSHIICLP